MTEQIDFFHAKTNVCSAVSLDYTRGYTFFSKGAHFIRKILQWPLSGSQATSGFSRVANFLLRWLEILLWRVSFSIVSCYIKFSGSKRSSNLVNLVCCIRWSDWRQPILNTPFYFITRCTMSSLQSCSIT